MPLVLSLAGCWTLKPGTDLPDGGANEAAVCVPACGAGEVCLAGSCFARVTDGGSEDSPAAPDASVMDAMGDVVSDTLMPLDVSGDTPDAASMPPDTIADVVSDTFDAGGLGVDTASESGTDSTAESGVDVQTDASRDAGTDTVPMDVPDVTTSDVPVDAGVDVSADTGVDVPRPDVPTDTGTVADAGPVGVGFYTFSGASPPIGMLDPVAIAWHPSGSYALILGETNNVYRYSAGSRSVTSVATASGGVSWRMAAFTADGTIALLIGSIYNSGSSTYTGHLYAWTDATSSLAELTAEQWTGGSYESIRFSPDGSQAALLGRGNPLASESMIWFVSLVGHRTSIAAAQLMAMGTGCDDLSWTTDAHGAPALDMVCGYNTGAIYRVTGLGTSGTAFTMVAPGDEGNTNSIAGTRGGSIELAVSGAAERLYRMAGGVWSVGFATPPVMSATGVSFNDVGTRAFAFGGAGYLDEYRTDDYTAAGITESQIPISGPPWSQPSTAALNDVQWRPGCDEGLAVGGTNSFSGTSSFIAYFAATNGRSCP